MEVFETYDNNQKINARLKKEPTSIGSRYGKVYFYLRKEDDLNQYISLNNLTQTNTKIEKKDINNYNILEVVTQMTLTDSQKSNKEDIMKATKIDYSFFDIDNRKSFNSNYLEHSNEYNLNGESEVFVITKLVRITLSENPQITHENFIKTLNI